MVVIDMRVAGRNDVEIDAAMAGDDIEHVREKADRCLDARMRAVAVEIDRDGHVRFFGGASDCGYAHDESASRNASLSDGVPIETRSAFGTAARISRMRMPLACRSLKMSFASRAVVKAMKFERDGNGVTPSMRRIASNTPPPSPTVFAPLPP